nr:hypothetical protein [Tanacetum cinerariifolium]
LEPILEPQQVPQNDNEVISEMIGGNGGNQFRQYAGNLNGYNKVQNVRNQVAPNPRVQNVGNQNGLIGVQGNGIQNQIGNGNLVVVRAEGNAAGQNANHIRIQNQIGNGNLVAARTEGNAAGQNANQIRCYNCRGLDGETVEHHPTNFEETRALYESLYQNLAVEVEKVNSVNRKLKETNADMTTELAR